MQVTVLKVDPARAVVDRLYRLDPALVVHKRSVYIGLRGIAAARRHAEVWGAGMAAPPVPLKQERHFIAPGTAEHLLEWVFRFDFLEVLKMTGRNIEGGHCYAVKEAAAATYPEYCASANAATPAIRPVSRKVYNRVLSDKVFIPQKKVARPHLDQNPNPVTRAIAPTHIHAH